MLLSLAAYSAVAEAKGVSLRASLSGFEEIISPTQGAVFTTGSGEFRGRISPDGTSIEYELTYDFPAPGPVTGMQYVNQAHLHFGQRHTLGGIIAFLCFAEAPPLDAASVPMGTPSCPSPGGMVTGTLTAASIIGPEAQGISPIEFAKLVDALRSGAVYANVHTDVFPAGEIRGQVRAGNALAP